jgi:hypothetical protein
MIHILYRHTDNLGECGYGKNRPKWFSYEKCLNNILKTIEGKDYIQFHLIYDGKCSLNDPRIDKVEEINFKSPMRTWIHTWDYAKKLDLSNSDLIYHLENDYMHVENWSEKVIELYETYEELNYVSLYDHIDKYNPTMYPTLQSNLFITPTHHWRTTPSTCGAFIINKKILFEDYDVWTSSPGDHYKFIWLAQNRGRNVLTPIPSLSTHCEVEWLAPTIDWNKIN